VHKQGLAGAALAVVISQYTATLMLLRSLVVERVLCLTDLGKLPDPTKIFAYLSAGSSLLLRTVSMQTFYTIMTSVGARMGTAVIAAHAIARQCSSLEALVVDGLAVAAQVPRPPQPHPTQARRLRLGRARRLPRRAPGSESCARLSLRGACAEPPRGMQALVAMYIGKGDRISARRLTRRLLLLGACAGTVLGALLFFLSGPIASAFSTDPVVLAEARRAMPLVAAIQARCPAPQCPAGARLRADAACSGLC
jgi:Na+-driven multidrug efflux pump